MKHNFKKMSDEELVALQETADEQTAAAIEVELNRRAEADLAQAANNEASAEVTSETDDNDAALDELLKSCQTNINHRCKLVPVGTLDWVDGVIVGCVKIKRSNTVAYAVKLDNGKRVVKNYKAPLFEITDEVVERVKATAGSRAKAEPWSDEKMAEEIAKYIGNVGRDIIVKDAEGNDITGMITGLVPVKRSNSILYRVVLPAPTEEDPAAKITVHKSVVNTEAFTICDVTEDSDAFNAEYMARRESAANRQPLTGAELILDLELKLEKAKEAAAKAQAKVDSLIEAIAAKKVEAEAEATGEGGDENML